MSDGDMFQGGAAPIRGRRGPVVPDEPMNIRDEYDFRDRRAGRRLRRAVGMSVITHALVIGGAVGAAHWWGGGPPVEGGFVMEFLAAGLPDAPEGLESTRVEGLPPGPPEAPPAAPPKKEEKKEEPKPEPPKEEKKPDPPKEEKKPEPPKEEKKPDPPKEVKKPEPPKEEKKPAPKASEKKPDPPKEEKKPDPPKRTEPPKSESKKETKPAPAPELDLASLLDEDLEKAGAPSAGSKSGGGGGLANARPSTQAQTGYGDPNSVETGISQRGLPSVLSTWAKQVERQVLRFWNEPGGIGRANKVAIAFWVDRNGNLIGDPQIVEPSSDASLDQSGLNAIRTAAPFPPLPQGFTGNRQQVIFIFRLA